MRPRWRVAVTSMVLVMFLTLNLGDSYMVLILLLFKMYLFNTFLCMYDAFHNKMYVLITVEYCDSLGIGSHRKQHGRLCLGWHLPVPAGLPLFPFST